jgi:hypothetical protein
MATHGSASHPRRRFTTRRIVILGLLVALSYVLASPILGLGWPYPQRLPDRYRSAGNWYEKDDGRQTRDASRLVRVGEMWTALGPIGRPAIYVPRSAATASTPPTLFVKASDGCYQSYDGQSLPGAVADGIAQTGERRRWPASSSGVIRLR